MNNQSQVTPVIRVENTDIPVTVYQDRRVITTELMAQVYGSTEKNIHDNFNNNKDRFEEGKHYFKLEGETLRNFKKSLTRNIRVSQQARHFILWTERGAARHAKMLDTDQAWDVFDKLEAAYFDKNQLFGNSEQLNTAQHALPESKPMPAIRTRVLVATEGDTVSQSIVPDNACIVIPDNTDSLHTFINEMVPLQHIQLVFELASRRILMRHQAALKTSS